VINPPFPWRAGTVFTTLLVLLLWGSSGCYRLPSLPLPGSTPPDRDGRYDTAFPDRSAGAELERIAASVVKLYHTAYYRTYIYPAEARLTLKDLRQPGWENRAGSIATNNQSAFGTATLIYAENQRVVFLSVAHLGYLPDTIITHYDEKTEPLPTVIQSVAIKQRSKYFIDDFFEDGTLEVLALDPERDLLLVGKRLERAPRRQPPVFPYPLGEVSRLDWGSFVYLIGYPQGQKMITRALVSPAAEDPATFMVDGLFNMGLSGGILLALRDGVPNFELVGLAKSVAVDTHYYLAPEPRQTLPYNPRLPYLGDAYVRQKRTLNYGVTYAVSVQAIRDFLQEQQPTLLERGYDLSALLQ
jgi:hypothetical protein